MHKNGRETWRQREERCGGNACERQEKMQERWEGLEMCAIVIFISINQSIMS